MKFITISFVPWFLLAAACGDRATGGPDIGNGDDPDGGISDAACEGGACGGVPRRTVLFPQTIEQDIDLLFVMDNSGSMAEEQASLSLSFRTLIDGLRNADFGPDESGKPCTAGDNRGCKLPNLRIGVVSTDLGAGNYGLPTCEQEGGDNGRLEVTPRVSGCVAPKGPEKWISYTDTGSGVQTNVDDGDPFTTKADEVKASFGCIARLGTEGCGFEQTLEAARLAIERNRSFLRQDALLGLIFVTDEDDCSAADSTLFDTSSTGLKDPLGPLTSFRCFEFGIECEDPNTQQIGPIDRTLKAQLSNCRPRRDRGAMLHPIGRYFEYFRGVKPGRPDRLVVAGLIGPADSSDFKQGDPPRPAADNDPADRSDLVTVTEDSDLEPKLKPSCTDSNGSAFPALRIRAFGEALAAAGGTFQQYQTCAGNFAPAMAVFGKRLAGKAGFIGGQCLPWPPLLANGAAACAQGVERGDKSTCKADCLHELDCAVSEKTAVIERCTKDDFYDAKVTTCSPGKGPCPCWRIVKKTACDQLIDGSPFGLQILRESGKEPAEGSYASVTCHVSEDPWTHPDYLARPICQSQ